MYVNTATGQYPYTVGHFRRDHSNTSFPKNISETLLARYGIKKVVYADKPSYNVATQKLVEASQPVRETNGVYTAENAPNESMIGNTIYTGRWIINYTVTDMTEDEITANDTEAARLARITRNRLLAATDYLALTDNTLDDITTQYRQALRDITTHENWPHLSESDWPTAP